MGSLAPGKTLFAHWVLALAKMLVLTSCAADKMLFLASPSLKEMFLESSFQREDVQIDYNTCSRARYLCEPGFLAFFFFFLSMASLPPFALWWWYWFTALWILKHCSASKFRRPSSFCFPQLLTDSDWLTLLQVCVMHPFPLGLSPHTWKIAYPLFLTPPVKVWHPWAWEVLECSEGPSGQSHMEGSSLHLFLVVRDWSQEPASLAKYTLTKRGRREEGNDRLSHLIHFHMSSHHKVMLYNTFTCSSVEFWASTRVRSFPYVLSVGITTMKELGSHTNVGLQTLNSLSLECRNWHGM